MKKINWGKVTNFIKKKNFIMAVCVFGLTMASIGFSYASFFAVKTNSSNQSVTTGTLNVSYGTDTSAIQLSKDLTPMSDYEGMKQSDSSFIYIQNTGSLNSTYVLNIGYDMTNFKGRSGYSSSDVLTPIDYIRFAVYEYNGVGTEDTLIAGPLSISDLPIYSFNSDSNYNRYLILFDSLGGTSTTNNTKTYKLKLWLSDKTIPTASLTYFYVNSEVVAEVENAKMKYNLSGTITDGTNNLNGAIINIQNGSIKSTSSSGAFTLNGLYPGTYNVDITYDNIVYSGNLTVVEGTSNSLVSMGTSFSGNDIFSVANTYGTTVNKIITMNNIDTYSSAATISSGSLYPTYRFTGGATEDVSGLKIVLDTTNKTFTMTL